jgi:streptogramin lyase
MKRSLKTIPLLVLLLLAAPAAAAPTVTEFPIPTANSTPQDIVLGPDGKLWFTEKGFGINKIGRVTPGNPPVIEDFPLPTGSRIPSTSRSDRTTGSGSPARTPRAQSAG